MAAAENVGKKACVVGGTGFVASCLVKLLLEKGYAVNTTVRDPDDQKRVHHLVALQNLGDLKIFQADLTDETSFDAPIEGCVLVFLVATPVNFASEDPENDMIKPAKQGVINVLKACSKAKSVKRVILTSSAAAVSINNKHEGSGVVMNEDNWTDVEFLYSQKPPTWGALESVACAIFGCQLLSDMQQTNASTLASSLMHICIQGYPASKTLAETVAWEFAKQNNIDLITVIPTLMSGYALTSDIPSSIGLATCLITGNEFLINGLKGMQMLSGSISITHVEDVCRAHIFLAEKKPASGRYICCATNTSVPQLAEFLNVRYPQYQVPTQFGDFPSKNKFILSSEKLIKEGFCFKYGIEEIFDHSVEYLTAKGVLLKK